MSLSFTFSEWKIIFNEYSKPQNAVLELTTKCNFQCIHCFRNVMYEKFIDMEFEDLKRIVNQLKELNVRKIVLTGWGEPTIYPYFQEVLKILKDNKFEIILNTNGSTLKDYAKYLVNLQINEIYVSIESIKSYSRYRIGGFLENLIEGLELLSNLKFERNTVKPVLNILYTITSENYTELPYVMEFCSKIHANKLIINNFIPISKEYQYLTCIKNSKLIDEIEKYVDIISRQAFLYGIAPQSVYFTIKSIFKCPFIENNTIYITSDCKLCSCMFFAHKWKFHLNDIERTVERIVFGDLNENSIINIWKNEKYQYFRFKVKTKQMPSCLDCELEPYCTYTLNNLHDCFGNNPTCAFCPYSKNLTFCPI